MNVEKLQKINALANELKKHNFANDNDDAYKKAETVYEGAPARKSPEPEPKSMKVESGLEEKKMQLLLEMHSKKYEEELTRMRNAINELISEVNSLKERKPEPVKKEVQKPLKTEEKKSHPRQGDFTSDDVSIQEMFYFGNKH